MKITTTYFILILVSLMILLTSCGENRRLKELKNNVAQLKKQAEQTKKNNVMSEFELPNAIQYGINSAESSANAHSANGNPLQSYPLKSLRFVGVINQNNKTWAYIMTPDSMIYPAKEGDMVGDKYGKIAKIDSNHVEVVEKGVSPGNTTPTLQTVTMQLKE